MGHINIICKGIFCQTSDLLGHLVKVNQEKHFPCFSCRKFTSKKQLMSQNRIIEAVLATVLMTGLFLDKVVNVKLCDNRKICMYYKHE